MKRTVYHLSILCLCLILTRAAAQSENSFSLSPLKEASSATLSSKENINSTAAHVPLAARKVGITSVRPHVDALRQQLGLSSDLELQWLPSRTGSDTLRVTDRFNRSAIGPDWALDSRYWAIKDGELVLTKDANYEWRYLAVFLPVFNNSEREIYSVTYTWGKKADAVGIGEGAHALMIDPPSAQGSGYWLWRRTNQNSVWLYAIKDGAWEYTPGESKEFHRADSHTPIPQAGDVITTVIRNEPHAVFFDYYINDHWDATVYDGSKEFAQDNEWYTGVFIHGQDLNNQVDDFTVTWFGGDTVPPAAVTDLRAIDSTATSVTLAWTAPGDNFWDGQADHFEIRYDTAPFDEDNFDSAELAANLPEPAPSGELQQFTITGLQKNKTYYFALRAYDEANNKSGLSNLAQVATKEISVASALELVSGCDQAGVVGTPLPLPIVVVVKDQEGSPFATQPVKFAIKTGEARFANDAIELHVNSDENGQAAVEVKLGTTPGAITIEISAPGLQNSPVLCNAEAHAGAVSELVQVSGDRQLLSVGKESAPLVVRATDQYGNSIVQTPIAFEIANGGGRFANNQTSYIGLTELNGTARAEIFAGEIAGDTTTVTAGYDSSHAIHFLIFTAAADSLLAVSGDNQTAPVRTQLAEPLVVRALDELGEHISNIPILFSVSAGEGVLENGETSAEVMTDSSGAAAMTWKLGPHPGLNQLTAVIEGLPSAQIVFNATGEIVSNVKEAAAALPKEFALLPNSPNPFNPETTIHFALPEAAEVTLVLFDANGRRVRNLMSATLNAGAHQIRWDGRAANSRGLDSGVYFCRMRAVAKASGKSFEATRKLMLAK